MIDSVANLGRRELEVDIDPDWTTNWTTIYLFNGILYALLAVFTFMLCMTCLVWPMGKLGGIGHGLGCCAHLAAIIVTGVFRYSTEGELCASNSISLPYNKEGDEFTFAEKGDTIQALFISACCLFCCFNCFVGVMGSVSNSLVAIKRTGLGDLTA